MRRMQTGNQRGGRPGALFLGLEPLQLGKGAVTSPADVCSDTEASGQLHS